MSTVVRSVVLIAAFALTACVSDPPDYAENTAENVTTGDAGNSTTADMGQGFDDVETVEVPEGGYPDGALLSFTLVGEGALIDEPAELMAFGDATQTDEGYAITQGTLGLPRQFTREFVEAWVNSGSFTIAISATTTADGLLLRLLGTAERVTVLGIGASSGQIEVSWRVTPNTDSRTMSFPYARGRAAHIVLTAQNGVLRAFYNGQLAGAMQTPFGFGAGTLVDFLDNIELGLGTQTWGGTLHSFQTWDRALRPYEIWQMFRGLDSNLSVRPEERSYGEEVIVEQYGGMGWPLGASAEGVALAEDDREVNPPLMPVSPQETALFAFTDLPRDVSLATLGMELTEPSGTFQARIGATNRPVDLESVSWDNAATDEPWDEPGIGGADTETLGDIENEGGWHNYELDIDLLRGTLLVGGGVAVRNLAGNGTVNTRLLGESSGFAPAPLLIVARPASAGSEEVPAPFPTRDGDALIWDAVDVADHYEVYSGGRLVNRTRETRLENADSGPYAVVAVDEHGVGSVASGEVD